MAGATDPPASSRRTRRGRPRAPTSAALMEHWCGDVARLGARRGAHGALRGEENAILTARREVMVMRELPAGAAADVRPRARRVRRAGRAREPTRRACCLPFAANCRSNRLGLAQWLVAPNPLTARVPVNRFWEMFSAGPCGHGRGLRQRRASADASRSCSTGWRATSWTGWDVKALQRLIVTVGDLSAVVGGTAQALEPTRRTGCSRAGRATACRPR